MKFLQGLFFGVFCSCFNVNIVVQEENDKMKAIMDEERRLKVANENLLKDICVKVVEAAGKADPVDTVKSVIAEHNSNTHVSSLVWVKLCPNLTQNM